jgi:hypothetical protein
LPFREQSDALPESWGLVTSFPTLGLDAVGFDFVVEGLAADAEAFGGFEFVAAGFFEHLDDGVAFDAFEEGEVGVLRFITDGAGFGDGEVDGIDFVSFAQQDCALNFVLQLADVTGPVEAGESIDGGLGVTFERAIGLGGEAFQEGIGQGHDVFAAFAQRGKMNGDGADAVEQVLAQLAIFNGFVGFAIGGGDDAAIGFVADFAADGAHFLVLQDAEEFALCVDGHFGDFVQEQGATFSLAEEAFAVGVSAGKGALDGAEEFAFDQFAGKGGAVDFDEWPLVPAAQSMNQVRHDFFARAAFTGDQHRNVAWGDAFDGPHDSLHLRALKDR